MPALNMAVQAKSQQQGDFSEIVCMDDDVASSCAQAQHEQLVKLLLRCQASVDVSDRKACGRAQVVHYYVKSNRSPLKMVSFSDGRFSRQGVTPLHLATFDGSLDTMKTLISARPLVAHSLQGLQQCI